MKTVDIDTEQRLMDRNKKLIDMVIKRAKRDFPEDIALIGITGSFSTGDFHENSDLDLLIVINDGKAWDISECFILDDIGYDFYCTPWERLEQMATLESLYVTKLTDGQILYSAKPEYLERFNKLKTQLMKNLAKPLGADCISRAKKNIDTAKQHYADMMLSESLGKVRFSSGNLVYNLAYCILHLNNACIKRGTKRFFEEVAACRYLPENFEKLYMSVIEAKTVDSIQNTSRLFLAGTIHLYEDLYQQFIEQPSPKYENLEGIYEECWSNYGNKIVTTMNEGDKPYAFLVAVDTQSYFDEMTFEHCGTTKTDLMQSFDIDNLEGLKNAFLEAMDKYQSEYEKAGRKVLKFETFDELYDYYMK